MSNPKNTKSEGPFVVHLLHPKMVCKYSCTKSKDEKGHEIDNYSVELLELFDSASEAEVDKVMSQMAKWAWINS